MSKAQGKSSCS